MAETFAELGRSKAIEQLFDGSGYSPYDSPLRIEGESVVCASRLLLEGTDFNLVYFPLKHLGYKSVVCATGDLLAAIARPQSLSIVLGVSSKLDYEQIKDFWQGVIVAAKEFAYSRISLDLIPSRNGLAISISASACRTKLCMQMKTAQSKDLICVSGSLGAAYLGQQVLEHKRDELEKNKMLVAAYLKPEVPANIVDALQDSSIVPSYGAFVTRGLSEAIINLSKSTGLGAKVYANRIPFEGNSFAIAKELDIDPISAAMNGGDDYRLLFTIPISDYERFRTDFQVFDIIGHLALPQVGAVLVSPDGLEHPITAL